MVFWIAILVGVLFAWLGVRLGFYETWILCFNVIVSIYVAIFLAPFVSLLLLSRVAGEDIHVSSIAGLALIVGGILLQRRLG